LRYVSWEAVFPISRVYPPIAAYTIDPETDVK
jgi:hypothetical protein